MPPKSGNKIPTVVDSLQECLQILSEAELLPDAPAHKQVLDALRQGIVQYIQTVRQKSIAQAVGGGQQGPGGQPGGPPQPGAGGPPGGPGGMPPGGPQAGPGGGPGGQPPASVGVGPMQGFGTPNPDELNRVLAGPAAVKGG